jgi:anti-sigma factor ChrR (cupin superfamily)
MKISELENPVPVHFEQSEFHSIDGVFIRKIHIPKDCFAPQHSHAHSHATVIGKGKIIAWKGKECLGEFSAGEIIEIEANIQHTFLALEDTDIFCIHNEEHALVVSEGKIEV